MTGGQNNELDPFGNEHCYCGCINRGFRQPHSFGKALKTGHKVLNTPANLRVLIAITRQGQNNVVVDLGNGITMAIESLGAHTVSCQNALIHLNIMLLNPSHEGWPDIKAQVFVVVDDINHPPLVIKDAGKGIGTVALRQNTLVPVGKGCRTWLRLNRIEVGIFAGRLIKMAVNGYMHPNRLTNGCTGL